MKTIEISSNSWHYRLLREFGVQDADDICQYTRRLVLCLIGCVAFGSLGAVAAGSVLYFAGDTIAWIVACIAMMNWLPIGNGAIVFLGLVFACLVVFCGPVWYERGTNSIRQKMDTPFMRTAYDSWKNKWCARVEVK